MDKHKKHIVILGAGESGAGAALLAQQQEYDVFVSDGGPIAAAFVRELEENNIRYEQGGHTEALVLKADEVVKSPGIPEKASIMKKIREAGIPVISEIELAYRFAKGKKIIAITGSNGKTTTTALTYDIFKKAGLNAACVGNIGNSFARQVALAPADYYIVEISSFQLDDIQQFRPEVAVLLNITPDHLDRYDHKMEQYAAAKLRIVENQGPEDYFIYCLDDPGINQYLKNLPVQSKILPFTTMEPLKEGGFIANKELNLRVGEEEDLVVSIYDLALQGRHNLYNSMAAGIAARTMDIRNEHIRASLTSFRSLEHRLEYVASVRGIDFINDSKATNINSVWFALESMHQPVVLIMGGIDKGNDYSIIAGLVKEKVKAIVCLGKDNHLIHDALAQHVPVIVNTESMHDAVHASFFLSQKGDVVLLSPACSSFDLFKNYEDRGRQFKQEVHAL
ncbi:UDP-N-acetylmuramoyl-L-alanine--D-glutamate ligase [Compostibacter hankyongensis]|uniref:UDP-N-acetylmuramoylalanine--D-glutamate ligase n=1 Tax=Compostibacter hankyongensis TaxID=1007089 RepID=A0ABP8FGY2_9BACT